MATTSGISKPDIEKKAQELGNGKVKVNNWAEPGPAAFDFRSTSCPSFIPSPTMSRSKLTYIFQAM